MKKLLIVLFLAIGTFGFAQDMSINGKVLDGAYENQPLAFANIRVEGLDISVETDLEGIYQLPLLKGSYTLIFDFIGYRPIVMKNVILSGKNLQLDPVVLETQRMTPDILLAEKAE